jgi:hypothetical protein
MKTFSRGLFVFVFLCCLPVCCQQEDAGDTAPATDDSDFDSQTGSQLDSDTYTPVDTGEVSSFLGGKQAVLVWVDAGGRINLWELSKEDHEPALLSEETSCVNPILSPDGTRVVYSRGQANGPKQIFLRSLAGGDPTFVATGDLGYFAVDKGVESIVYSDWSDKAQNGLDGKTYRRALIAGTTTFSGQAQEIHSRAMDAGPNRDLSWLGQVYDNMLAFDMVNSVEYGTDKFALADGSPADHQTCNGSMAPDSGARMMVLVIPHDWLRIFTHSPATGRFEETSRFELPSGLAEWEYPEWSTHVDYFTAVLRAADRKNRLFIGKVEDGVVTPQLIEVVGRETSPSYSHLWVAP